MFKDTDQPLAFGPQSLFFLTSSPTDPLLDRHFAFGTGQDTADASHLVRQILIVCGSGGRGLGEENGVEIDGGPGGGRSQGTEDFGGGTLVAADRRAVGSAGC